MSTPPRDHDPSIKARKQQLYDDPADAAPTGPRRSFAEVLKATPAAPLSGGTKASLWAVGVLVALLLGAALVKSSRPRVKAAPKGDAARYEVPRSRLS